MTDAARVCGVYDAKPYRDGDGLRQVRFYRVPNGTPILPFPHVFTHPNWLLHNDDAPPGPGTAGVMPGQVAYDKGIRPVLWGNDGFPCGDKRIWLDGGSIAGGDVGLTWTEWEFTTCCLAKRGFAIGASGGGGDEDDAGQLAILATGDGDADSGESESGETESGGGDEDAGGIQLDFDVSGGGDEDAGEGESVEIGGGDEDAGGEYSVRPGGGDEDWNDDEFIPYDGDADSGGITILPQSGGTDQDGGGNDPAPQLPGGGDADGGGSVHYEQGGGDEDAGGSVHYEQGGGDEDGGESEQIESGGQDQDGGLDVVEDFNGESEDGENFATTRDDICTPAFLPTPIIVTVDLISGTGPASGDYPMEWVQAVTGAYLQYPNTFPTFTFNLACVHPGGQWVLGVQDSGFTVTRNLTYNGGFSFSFAVEVFNGSHPTWTGHFTLTVHRG